MLLSTLGFIRSIITQITFPSTLTIIKESAFNGCTGLTSVDFVNGLQTIENQAFNGCTGLTQITLPNTLTSIGEQSFANCTALTSLDLGNGLKKIGKQVIFRSIGITQITIPASVTEISARALEATGLQEVIFEKTTGWTAGTVVIESSQLEDPTNAKDLLKVRHLTKIWTNV